MLKIEDAEKFDAIVTEAVEKAAAHPRWISAIGKAVEMLETQGEWLTYFKDENYLLVWSQSSNQIYSANGQCQCLSFTKGIELTGKPFPCWHRCLARLVRLYFGGLENVNPKFPNVKAEKVNPDTAPYFPAKLTVAVKRQKIGGVWV